MRGWPIEQSFGRPVPFDLNILISGALVGLTKEPAMSPNEPEPRPEEQPAPDFQPEVEPAGSPDEIPPFDPGGGEGDFGQPMS